MNDPRAAMAATTSPEVEVEGTAIVHLKEEHNNAFAGTLRRLSVEKTKNDHCNRLQRMIEFDEARISRRGEGLYYEANRATKDGSVSVFPHNAR